MHSWPEKQIIIKHAMYYLDIPRHIAEERVSTDKGVAQLQRDIRDAKRNGTVSS